MTEVKIEKHTLPSDLKAEQIFMLLDEIKNRPGSSPEDLAKRTLQFSRAKSAALELKFIQQENGKIILTENGKIYAWANPEQKPDLLLINHILAYEPYEIALSRFLKEKKSTMESEYIQSIWATVLDMTLSGDKLAAAVPPFFQLLQFAEVGEYLVGRRQYKTRLELTEKGRVRLEKSLILSQPSNQGLIPTYVQPLTTAVSKQAPIVTEPAVTTTSENQEEKLSSQKDWTSINTEFFTLKIDKTPETWDLLEDMIKMYRKRLHIGENKGVAETNTQNETKAT